MLKNAKDDLFGLQKNQQQQQPFNGL